MTTTDPYKLQDALRDAQIAWARHKDGNRSYGRACSVVAQVCVQRGKLPQDVDHSELTYAVCEAAVTRAAAGKSEATRNRLAAAFSAVLKQFRVRGLAVPSLSFCRETGARKDHLSRTDAEKLLAELGHTVNGHKWRAVTKALLLTGMRISEFFACLGMPGLTHTPAFLSEDKKHVLLTLTDTKNGRPRVVPISSEAWKKVYDTVSREDKRDYQRAFKDAADRLWPGRGIVPHSLRHTCASWMSENGVPLSTISDYLGHKSLTTTRRYAHLSTKNLRTALEAIAF